MSVMSWTGCHWCQHSSDHINICKNIYRQLKQLRTSEVLMRWLFIKSVSKCKNKWNQVATVPSSLSPLLQFSRSKLKFSVRHLWPSVTRLGDFWKLFLGNKMYTNWSPNDLQLFGRFWKTSLWCKNYIGYFLGNFWKNWATFYFFIWSH